MKKIFFASLVLILMMSLIQRANSQSWITGYVADSLTGERLPGVNILVKDYSNGTSTGPNGFFLLYLKNAAKLSFVAFFFAFFNNYPNIMFSSNLIFKKVTTTPIKINIRVVDKLLTCFPITLEDDVSRI